MQYDYPREPQGTVEERILALYHDLHRLVQRLNLEDPTERVNALEAETKRLDGLLQDSSRIGAAARRTAILAGEAATVIPTGTIDAGSTSTKMTATVPGITKIVNGTAAYIRNGVVTSAAGWTLNVNGLGAYPVYQTMAAATAVSSTYNINYTMLFVFDSQRIAGGCWDMYYGYDSNTNTLAYNVRTNATRHNLTDRLSRYMMCFTDRDHRLVPSYTVASGNGTTATTKTLNTSRMFDPLLPILWYQSNTNVPANTTPNGTVLWRQYSSCELRYAFNAGTSLQACKACYVRCDPQIDGMVSLDGNDCLVQELPTTEDGKVYIYLGMAYGSSGYTMELDPEHPAYEYKNGSIVPWYGGLST